MVYIIGILVIIIFLFYIGYFYRFRDNREGFEPYFLIDGKDHTRDIIPEKKSAFLESKFWRPVDVAFDYRTDITTPKTGYQPNELSEVLNPLIDRRVYNKLSGFKKIDQSNSSKLNSEMYLEILDKYLSRIINNIYRDLLKNGRKRIMCPNINACPIELLDKKIWSLYENDKYYKIIVIVVLNIGNKEFNHVLKLVLLTTKSYDEDYLVDIKIVGSTQEEMKEYYPFTPELIISRDEKYPYRANKGYLRINEKDSIILKEEDISKKHIYLEKQFLINTSKKSPPYECIGSRGNSKIECESPYDSEFRPKERGVWDRYCIKDSDCPFFQKNTNYPNTRGGCIEGKCEMPMGVKPLGNRYFDIDSVPMCYNCHNDRYDCCSEQKNPDYIFQNDLILRTFNKRYLDERGLDIN
jgi:hypothetical protein